MARQKLTSNNKVEGSTLTSSEWNGVVTFANANYDDIQALNTSVSKNAANIKTAKETAESALRLANGAQEALSYADYSAMITALEATNSGALNVGQQILIVKSDVPDVWLSANNGNGTVYTYTTDAAVETALKSSAGLVGSWYTLRPLETGKVDLSDYYTKEELDGVKTTTGSTYGKTIGFVPSDATASRSTLTAMSGNNMAGPISLKSGDKITTSVRTDITIYRVWRSTGGQIAAGCTIQRLGTGSATADSDMEVLLYDTQGKGLVDTNDSAFVGYSVAHTVSVQDRLETLEAGLSASAVSDSKAYTDITGVLK